MKWSFKIIIVSLLFFGFSSKCDSLKSNLRDMAGKCLLYNFLKKMKLACFLAVLRCG